MADIEKTGDWDGFAQLLANAGAKFKANVKKATDTSGRQIEGKIVSRIAANQVQPPTSEAFRKWKERHGYFDTTLIMTGSLINAVKYDNLDWNNGFVGVKRNTTGKDGQSLVSIAATMEYGTHKGKKGLPKPFIRPVVEQCVPELVANYQKAIEETFKK